MLTKTEQTREHILNVGRELIAEYGFTAMGIGQLLKQANVPKGSFYHYFASKEIFGCELLEYYVVEYRGFLNEVWSREERNGRQKLLDYFDKWIATQWPASSQDQCLVVKLAAEISDMSESMRTILETAVSAVIDRLADQVRLGIEDGSLAPDMEPEVTATQLYQMWLGASLMVKLEQADAPFLLARENTEKMLRTP